MFEEIVDQEEVVEVEEEATTEQGEPEVIDWEARAKAAEALIVKHKKAPKPDKKEVITSNESERIDRLELRADGYAPEVIDEIMKLGGKEALSNPILKNSADVLQAQYKAQRAADIQNGPNSTGKTKFSKEDLAQMSADEMEKVLPHADR